MSEFKCPQCGGKYWRGIDGRYRCGNLSNGQGMSMPDEATKSNEAMHEYLMSVKGIKPCGARFTREEMTSAGLAKVI